MLDVSNTLSASRSRSGAGNRPAGAIELPTNRHQFSWPDSGGRSD